MKKVLFVCIHNSARSQMAEALFRERCGDQFEVQSAGLEPGKLNPLAVEVLKERGFDISGKQTQGVFDVLKSGQLFAHVITVCDGASGQKCPIFPGHAQRHHWDLPDPSTFTGTHEEKLEQTRRVLSEIERHLDFFCEENCTS